MLQNLHEEFALDDSLSGMNRYHRAIDYFGEVIGRLCITAIAAYRDNGQPDAKINACLEKLSQPSLGDWNNLFNLILKWSRRMRSRTSVQLRHGPLFQKLHDVSVNRIETPEFLATYEKLIFELTGDQLRATGLPFRSLADATIRLRNRVAHGGLPPEDWLNRTADAVVEGLRLWNQSLPYLIEFDFKARDEAIPTDAGEVHPVVLTRNGEELFDFDCLMVEREGLYYHLNGNDRKQQVRYLNRAGSKILDDTSSLLKKQIVFFSELRGVSLKYTDLGSQVATSLPELSRILREYKYEPDKILGDDFQLLDEIGRGAMGIVYRALQISRDRMCAVKLLPKGIVMQDAIFQRFKREAQTLEALDHRNIVEFIEFGETEHDAYLVMEYIDGVTLDELFAGLRPIVNRRPTESDLLDILGENEWAPPSFPAEHLQRPYFYKIAEWIGQAAAALEHFHAQGIFHRDLKHANIMIERGTGRAVVLDFGLAKNQEMTLTLEGQYLGTLRFSSPEQLQAARHTFDERSDIYSLGIILYELLALRTSFYGDTFEQLSQQILMSEPIPLHEANPGTPLDLQTIAHKCIEKYPGKRYQKGKELHEDLKNWRENRPIAARPPTLLQRAAKWAARNPARTAVVASLSGALLVILGIATFFFYRLIEENIVTRKAIVEARSENAQALYSIGHEFDAAVSALQAGKVARELQTELDANGLQMARSALYRAHYFRRQGAWFQDLFNSVLDIRFSPDGEYLAVANEEFKTVNVFRLNDGQQVHMLSGHAGAVNALAFGPGELLASAGAAGQIRIWSYKKGDLLHEIKPGGAVVALAFEKETGQLVSALGDGTIIFWKADISEAARRPRAHPGGVSGLAFARNGTLASGGRDGVIRLWSADGQARKRIVTGSPVTALAFSKSGDQLASGHQDGKLRILDLKTNREQSYEIESEGALVDLAFSPDGEHLIISSGAQNVQFWRLADGTIQRRMKGHTGQVNAVDFDPKNRFAVSADETGSVRLWRHRDAEMVIETQEHSDAVFEIGYSPDGKHYASAGEDGLIKIWRTDGASGRRPGRVLSTNPGHKMMSFEFSPDGSMIFAGSWNAAGSPGGPVLGVWRVADGKRIHTLTGHRLMVYTMAYSPDQKYMASGDFANTEPRLKLWDATTGKEIWNKVGHSNSITSIRFTHDSRRMVTAGLDKKINVWDPEKGERLKSFELPLSMASLAVSPDDKYFVGGSYDGTLEFMRLADGKQLFRIKPHSRLVSDMAFSADGRYLVSASADRTLKIWKLGDGEPELSLTLHLENNPWSVAFHPDDSSTLLSSDSAGRLQHWKLNLDLDDLLGRGCSLAVRNYLVNNPNLTDPERKLCDDL